MTMTKDEQERLEYHIENTKAAREWYRNRRREGIHTPEDYQKVLQCAKLAQYARHRLIEGKRHAKSAAFHLPTPSNTSSDNR